MAIVVNALVAVGEYHAIVAQGRTMDQALAVINDEAPAVEQEADGDENAADG